MYNSNIMMMTTFMDLVIPALVLGRTLLDIALIFITWRTMMVTTGNRNTIILKTNSAALTTFQFSSPVKKTFKQTGTRQIRNDVKNPREEITVTFLFVIIAIAFRGCTISKKRVTLRRTVFADDHVNPRYQPSQMPKL